MLRILHPNRQNSELLNFLSQKKPVNKHHFLKFKGTGYPPPIGDLYTLLEQTEHTITERRESEMTWKQRLLHGISCKRASLPPTIDSNTPHESSDLPVTERPKLKKTWINDFFLLDVRGK